MALSFAKTAWTSVKAHKVCYVVPASGRLPEIGERQAVSRG